LAGESFFLNPEGEGIFRLTGRQVWRHQDFGRWGASLPDLEALPKRTW
jgi:hypothetical protein